MSRQPIPIPIITSVMVLAPCLPTVHPAIITHIQTFVSVSDFLANPHQNKSQPSDIDHRKLSHVNLSCGITKVATDCGRSF